MKTERGRRKGGRGEASALSFSLSLYGLSERAQLTLALLLTSTLQLPLFKALGRFWLAAAAECCQAVAVAAQAHQKSRTLSRETERRVKETKRME